MKPTFTQPCFIRKNTPELREKLDGLGYYPHPSTMPKMDGSSDGSRTFCNRGYYSTLPIGYIEEIERTIDCGENEGLFLAIAALRDDSDYMQWFCDNVCFWNKRFILCKEEEFKIYFNKVTNGDCGSYKDFHKATVEELIEHFKTDKQ